MDTFSCRSEVLGGGLFPGRRFRHLTSNIAESLNKWLLPAFALPVYPILEAMREQLMDWFAKR